MSATEINWWEKKIDYLLAKSTLQHQVKQQLSAVIIFAVMLLLELSWEKGCGFYFLI